MQTLPGREVLLTKSHSIRSFSQLKDAIDYAYLDEDLYVLIQNAVDQTLLMQAVLQTYFGHIPEGMLSANQYGIADQVVQQILHDDPATYRSQAAVADEEELFIRSGIFKKAIPKVYNYTCCVTGMRLVATRRVQMIVACHIIPFSESHDDTISNGLSLCPDLHRAFDRYLITMDTSFRVLVSDHVQETDNDYSIRKFEGRQIVLPVNREYLPGLKNLEWYNDQFYRHQ